MGFPTCKTLACSSFPAILIKLPFFLGSPWSVAAPGSPGALVPCDAYELSVVELTEFPASRFDCHFILIFWNL